MRLTCPRCRAQYQIADSAIPATGREVECSSCAHVWHEPGPEKSREAEASYDAGARPQLHRQLDDSILSILREETARELHAREPGTAAPPPAPDHIPANTAPADSQDTPPAPDDASPPESVVAKADSPAAALPDAALLAATLTRPAPDADTPSEPHLLLRPDPAEQSDPPSKPASRTPAPAPVAPEPVPAPRSRRGYAMGFGFAVMLALALLAAYALAPRVAPEDDGGAFYGLRHSLDQGRLWLHDRLLGD